MKLSLHRIKVRQELDIRATIEPLVDVVYYSRMNTEFESSGVSAVDHFLRFGAKAGQRPNAYFWPDWYIKSNPDIPSDPVAALVHYIIYGWREGRNPSPDFDGSEYLNYYPDVRDSDLGPLLHYLRYGRQENRNVFPPRNGFDEKQSDQEQNHSGDRHACLLTVRDSSPTHRMSEVFALLRAATTGSIGFSRKNS